MVAWRVFDEKRGKMTSAGSQVVGLMDTQMTLAVIGLCNLLTGWPLLILAHLTGFEEYQPPASWTMLNTNGFVEYLFDVSCAVSIYCTSPVLVAVASPLTIPLSLVADNVLNGSTAINSQITWFGFVVILSGIAVLEKKPKLKFPSAPFRSKMGKEPVDQFLV